MARKAPRIIVARPNDMDVVTLQVEHRDGLFESGDLKKAEMIKKELMSEISHSVKSLCGISASVDIVSPNTLPVAEIKARRVIDKRVGVWADKK